jgi:hypothetical protein
VGTLNACVQPNRSIFWDSLAGAGAGVEGSEGAGLGAVSRGSRSSDRR